MSEKKCVTAGCHLCWQQCEVELSIDEDGILRKVEGKPGSFSGGYACERVKAAPEFHYSDKRLNYPFKRVGERGENKWERITWDQALDEIAQKLIEIREEYGPESVAKMAGTIHGPADWSSWRFFCNWGSPNFINTGKNCGQMNTTVECAMYGWDGSGSAPEYGVTKNIVMWGANPPQSNNLKWNLVRSCMDAGARLIVIDPRFSETASYADLWLQPRPGTDGALGWAVINVLIEEELYDKEFVENWCTGFDQVAEKAKKYTPEWAERITDVPADKIRQFARWYADGPTNFNWNLTVNHLGDGAGYVLGWTQSVIRSITGNMDRRGGNQIPGPISPEIDWYGAIGWETLFEHLRNTDRDSLTAEHFPVCSKKMIDKYNDGIKKAWGGRGYGNPAYFFWPGTRGIIDGILEEKPYPVKALFIQAGDPIVTMGGAKKWHEAMKKVELLVGMDFFMTPSMELCDYVLPAASWIERPHMMLYWGVTAFNACYEQPMPALYERKDDYYLWKELAKRVGLENEWPDTLEGMYDLMLRPSGKTLKEVASQPDHWITIETEYETHEKNGYGFGTPSGKLELASSVLEYAGLDPVPDYVEPPISYARTPELARDYPLILISGSRIRPFWHGSYRELKTLRWQHEFPEVQIHPENARALNIVDGEMVYIETPWGRVRQKACVTEAIKPGVVHAEAYWYFPEEPAEEPYLFGAFDTNINAAIPDDYQYSDACGDLPFRGTLCRVYKVDPITNYDQPVFQGVEA